MWSMKIVTSKARFLWRGINSRLENIWVYIPFLFLTGFVVSMTFSLNPREMMYVIPTATFTIIFIRYFTRKDPNKRRRYLMNPVAFQKLKHPT